ncbi:hypothetical protein EGW08_006468, partial [Elysia chlorotica]
RPSLGTSLIVFAVPLLLPGITLTAVGFDDDSSFAKYGALHVIGLVLLCLSGLLLLVGTFLNIGDHVKVSPEDVKIQAVSTHESKVSTNDQSRDMNMTVVSLDPKESSPTSPAILASFLVDTGHSSARQDAHHVTFGESKVGARSGSILATEDAEGENGGSRRNFEPHSILASPKNHVKEALFDFHQTSDLSHAESVSPILSPRCAENLSHHDRPNDETSKEDSCQSPGIHSTVAGIPLRPMPKALPEIRAENSTSPQVEAYSTENLEEDKEYNSFESDRPKRLKKKKRRSKKTKSERLLEGKNERIETGNVDTVPTSIHFTSEDRSGFLSLDKRSGLATQTIENSNSIKEDTALAYSFRNNPHKHHDKDTLSIPKVCYRKTDVSSDNEKSPSGLRDRHSSLLRWRTRRRFTEVLGSYPRGGSKASPELVFLRSRRHHIPH